MYREAKRQWTDGKIKYMKPFSDKEERTGYLGLNSLLQLCHETKTSALHFITLEHSQKKN